MSNKTLQNNQKWQKFKIAFILTTLLAGSIYFIVIYLHQSNLNRLLIASLEHGDAQATLSLLKRGADPNALEDIPDERDNNNFFSVLLRMFDKSRNPEIDRRPTALLVAMAQNPVNPVLIRVLLDKGADVNASAANGYSALMYLCDESVYSFTDEDVFIVSLLLERGARVNAQNQSGRTALMIAAMEGNTTVVKMLLSKGADPHIKDNEGKIARSLAYYCNQNEVLSLLEDK